jgi:IclR family transcriptional regulator, KDG regulon repressor
MKTLKSLNKAIDVLELFPRIEENVSLAEISKLTRLDKSTVNRILATWVNRGYLKQNGKRGKYSLDTKFLDFSGVIKRRSRIRDKALPYLVRLAEITKESVILSILNGQYAAYNETIPSEQSLTIVPAEGTRVPLYCTGVGKILLAGMTDQEIENYINSVKLISYTPNTITHPDSLRALIAVIKKEGVVIDCEENALGINNVAAGVRDAEGKTVAAVGVLGPSVRLTRQCMTEIIPEIKKCALDISRELGYKA